MAEDMKPKLLQGWRFVEKGEVINAGDRLFNRINQRWQDCTKSIGYPNDGEAPFIMRKVEGEPNVTESKPAKKRWQKFTGKAPKFSDGAEAEFEVRCHSNAVAKNCTWLCSTVVSGGKATDYDTFHTAEGMPIVREAISHWRRA